MSIDPAQVEQVTKLLFWTAGVATTIAGSWAASKIRVYHDNRKSHLDDLKTKVLGPLHDGLRENYRDLVAHRRPVATVQWGRVALRPDAPVNVAPERHGPFLDRADPRALVENSMNRALLEDARQNHYQDAVATWEKLRDAWSVHCEECWRWVAAICQHVLERSQLPAFVDGQRVPQPYVMHLRLGCYVYSRLFEIPTDALRVETRQDLFGITGPGGGDLAMGTHAQIDSLLATLDEMLREERAGAEEIRNKAKRLESELAALLDKLSLALVSKGLTCRCRLAPFF